MNKIKDKYEVILGFVTLVVSLSAFKDELANVILELGYMTISLADYFLCIVYGFAICLYFYIVEHISRDSRIGTWKIFDYILRFAYFLFILILLTPILIILNLIILKLYIALTKNIEAANHFLSIINISVAILAFLTSYIASSKLFIQSKRNKQEEIEEQEIKEFANANKLFLDGYFSHSVLETFKVLETHLYKKLIEKDIRVSRHRIIDIINLALKVNIIRQEDLPAISDIRGMRNVAAHSDTVYTKQHAEFALNFLKQLLQRNETSQ